MKALFAAIATLVSLSVSTLPAAGQELRTLPIRRQAVTTGSIGVANLVTADYNGDGAADMITCSQGAPLAYSFSGGTYVPSWIGPSVGCTAVAAGDRNANGSIDVVVVTNEYPATGGKLLVFDPACIAEPVASIALPGTAAGADVSLANVDADPAMEIVVLTSAATYVFDAATLTLEWTAQGFGGSKFRTGDVNGDGRNEIVINGGTGYVLDAANQTMLWAYSGGFGISMDVGDVDNDNRAEIVFLWGDYYARTLTVLNGDTFGTTYL
jgi:hypothetical protein